MSLHVDNGHASRLETLTHVLGSDGGAVSQLGVKGGVDQRLGAGPGVHHLVDVHHALASLAQDLGIGRRDAVLHVLVEEAAHRRSTDGVAALGLAMTLGHGGIQTLAAVRLATENLAGHVQSVFTR